MNAGLRVALDVSAVPAEPVGAGRYTINLSRALSALSAGGAELDLELLARRDDSARWAAVAPAATCRPVAPKGVGPRLLWGEWGLPHALRREGDVPGVLHGPHYTMPARSPVPVVVTVHDTTFHDHPEWHERSKVLVFRRALRRAAARADLVICVSAPTAERFVEIYRPSAPVRVIPHGVDHERFSPLEPALGADLACCRGLGVPERYVLHLGTIEPRKNLTGVVAAFERLATADTDLELVLVGREAWGSAALDAALRTSPAAGRVRRLGYVRDEALPALLRRACVVVYPALEEGFGLPALEALACGAPLVTSEDSVMAKNAAGAALAVPARDSGLLAEAIAAVLAGGPELERRRALGLEVAARYSWEASAEAHVAAYQAAAL
ncbi:MAG: glycosyltransferase family 1 protein [Actinomycetota bacterium]|jgi:glycosyltransferase involved in cell wall biosynthesis|nr:glycosyltransferase family 1 protein [Actinomycetota bacterium]